MNPIRHIRRIAVVVPAWSPPSWRPRPRSPGWSPIPEPGTWRRPCPGPGPGAHHHRGRHARLADRPDRRRRRPARRRPGRPGRPGPGRPPPGRHHGRLSRARRPEGAVGPPGLAGRSGGAAPDAPGPHAWKECTTAMREDPVVTGLAAGAGNGEERAWDAPVDRYALLIWSICRRYRLAPTPAMPASASGGSSWSTWTRSGTRPRYRAGWPPRPGGNTHESGAARRAHAAGHALDAQIIPDHQARPVEQWLLAAERHAALREAFARLPPCCQRLITVLIQDRPCHTPRSAPGCRWRPWASSGACPRRRQAQLLRAGGLGVCRLPGLGWRWHWGEGSIVAPGAWKWPGVVPAVCPGLGRLRPAAAPAASPPQRVARRSARRRNRGASLASCSV